MPVKPSDYGLDPVEILLADDADLNEYFSVKKLAPFRKPEKIEKDEAKFKKSKKKRLWEFKQKLAEKQREINDKKKSKKRKNEEGEDSPSETDLKPKPKATGLSEDRLASYQMPKKKKSKY